MTGLFNPSAEILRWAENQLNDRFPMPESEIVRLSKVLAQPDVLTREAAQLRSYAAAIDDLIAETRWHAFQALTIWAQFPQITEPPEDDNPFYRLGIPADVRLMLRPFVARADQILYDDPLANRKGGTHAGWVFQMLLDGVIYRVVAALDRLANILWVLAKLGKGRPYFRTGKLKRIHQELNCEESKRLCELASSELMDFVLGYRDGFTHEVKPVSITAQFPPAYEIEMPDGQIVVLEQSAWHGTHLLALCDASYHLLLSALEDTCAICERYFGIAGGDTVQV